MNKDFMCFPLNNLFSHFDCFDLLLAGLTSLRVCAKRFLSIELMLASACCSPFGTLLLIVASFHFVE